MDWDTDEYRETSLTRLYTPIGPSFPKQSMTFSKAAEYIGTHPVNATEEVRQYTGRRSSGNKYLKNMLQLDNYSEFRVGNFSKVGKQFSE